MATPSKLPLRKLGSKGPYLPAIGLGMMGFSSAYGKPLPDEERFKVMDRAFELGETFWDSADGYGDSEDLIGKWFKRTGKREQIFITTKFGNITRPDGSKLIISTPEYAKEACNRSLKRLGVEYIDLYYCHRLDRKTPIEKTIQAMAELKNEGKIKYIGLSECSANTLRRACAVHHVDAVQVEYSPFNIDIESPEIELLKTCRELGVALVAYSPLGRGFVTGVYKSRYDFEEGDFRRTAPRFSDENFPNNLKLADAINDLAKKKGCTASQLTLAWLLAQGDDIFPIPGTKKIKYLEENLDAFKVKLTEQEVKAIRDVVEKADVKGARYGGSFVEYCYADTPELTDE